MEESKKYDIFNDMNIFEALLSFYIPYHRQQFLLSFFIPEDR